MDSAATTSSAPFDQDAFIDGIEAAKKLLERKEEMTRALFKTLKADYDKHCVLLNSKYYDIDVCLLPSRVRLSDYIPANVSHVIIPRDWDAKFITENVPF